jgi:hypothetical protein
MLCFQSLYYMSFGILSIGALPPGSPHGASIKRDRDAPFPKPSFDMSLGGSIKGGPPPGSPYRARCIERDTVFPEPSFTYLSGPQ